MKCVYIYFWFIFFPYLDKSINFFKKKSYVDKTFKQFK